MGWSENPHPRKTSTPTGRTTRRSRPRPHHTVDCDEPIKQLKFEGFSTKLATFGVEHISVNWKDQAAKKAESYLETQAFSKSGLIKQLKFEGFSNDQATYGVEHVSVSWKEQAVKKAESYLELQGFSRAGLMRQLQFEGFTSAQAAYGVKKAFA